MKTFLQEHKSWVILGAIVLVLGLLIYLFFSHRISWEMEATIIDVNTGEKSSTTLTIRGWKPNHKGRLHGQFRLGDNCPYLFATQVGGYLVADYLYNHGAPEGILHLHNDLYDGGINTFIIANMSLDLENECAIIVLEDHPGVYIVASSDPDMSPEDILAHFETTIAFWESLYNR